MPSELGYRELGVVSSKTGLGSVGCTLWSVRTCTRLYERLLFIRNDTCACCNRDHYRSAQLVVVVVVGNAKLVSRYHIASSS